jgi:predicted Zn-dependent peptidase
LFEDEKNKGISHFIEHMLFKGTKSRTNEKLNEELEQIGGEYNAYTDHNCTVCNITGLSEEVERSFELISDMLQFSLFSEEEMEKERGVILAEIRASKDDVEDYSFRKSKEAAFKKGPLRFDTIGDEKTVKAFTRKDLMDFYNTFYVPNNCYISVVSSFDHNYILGIIKKYFKEWQRADFERNMVTAENNAFVKKVSFKKDIEQSTIIYLYTFHNLSRKEELALKILNHKLGESANSILFRNLREEKGLAYDIFSQMDITNYVKILCIYTSVDEKQVEEAIEAIDSCIDKIKNRETIFDENVINLMKKVLKTAVCFTLEDSTDLSNYVFHQIIDDESIYEFFEDMNNLEDIEVEDVYNIAKKVLKEPTVHVLMPQKS